MFKNEKVDKLLKSLIPNGICLEFNKDLEDKFYIDLNTGMKSHAHLLLGEKGITLKRDIQHRVVYIFRRGNF